MVDTTTLNESLRSPFTGVENIRLATSNANWRAPIGNMFLHNVRLAKTANYTVASADAGFTLALGNNAFFTLTFGTASGYTANFACTVLNEDVYTGTGSGRAKLIVSSANDFDSFYLYPGQSVIIINQNNKWWVHGKTRWKQTTNTGTFNLFVNPSTGNDNNDGLASGAGNALQTLQVAYTRAMTDFDLFSTGPQVQINLADGTYAGGLHAPGPFVGYSGNASCLIIGNNVTPANVIWQGDGGGGFPLSAFDGAVFETQGVKFDDVNAGGCISAETGAVIRVQQNCIFGRTAAGGSQIQINSAGRIIFENNIQVSGAPATGNGFFMNCGDSGMLSAQGITVTYLANVTYNTNVMAAQGGNVNVGGVTWTLGAFTVTGQRYQANNVGNIMTFGGGANAIPGTVAGSTANGGTYF